MFYKHKYTATYTYVNLNYTHKRYIFIYKHVYMKAGTCIYKIATNRRVYQIHQQYL